MQQSRTEILAIKNGQDKKKILHQGHKVRVEESGQTIAHYGLIHKKQATAFKDDSQVLTSSAGNLA